MRFFRAWYWRAITAVAAGCAAGAVAVAVYTSEGFTNSTAFEVYAWFFRRRTSPISTYGFLGFAVFYGLPCAAATMGTYGLLTWRFEIGLVIETRCRHCGHLLRGLTEPRCSECGERI